MPNSRFLGLLVACSCSLLVGCELFGGSSMPDGDAGASADGGGGCGELTFEGRCDGSELSFCRDGVPVTVDCSADADHLTCYPSFPDWGADCAAPAGSVCGFLDAEGDGYSYLCLGTDPGCLWTSDGTVCTEHVGTCTDADVGTCRGSLAIFGCHAGQPRAFDCAEIGGSCAGSSCVDVPEGGVCAEGAATCASGLSCVDGVCTAGEPPPPGDARLVITMVGVRDARLDGQPVRLYRSEPRWFIGDRPTDVPEPIASAPFVDYVATFEGLAPGDYWFDYHWIADTNRIAYEAERVTVTAGDNLVDTEWRYVGAETNDITTYDVSNPWSVLVFHTTDPIVDGSQNGLSVNIDEVYGVVQLEPSAAQSGRCGALGDPSFRTVIIPPGSYEVSGSCLCSGSEYYRWRPRTVTVAADECQFVNLGVHDCTGIGC